MTEKQFKLAISITALIFSAIFFIICVPPLLELDGNLFIQVYTAVIASFVNPFSSGFASDTIACWFVLLFWILYEAKEYKVKHGWVCLIIGVVPGVAVGFALYLLLRHKQLKVNLSD